MTANGVPVDQELRMEVATEVNVSVLRRQDPEFVHVVQTASHAAVYKLDGEKWDRCDEGPAFIYKRKPSEQSKNKSEYSLICISRQKLENSCIELYRSSSADIEMVDEKTMAFPSKGDIYGVWVHIPEQLKPFHDALCAIFDGETVPALLQRKSGGSVGNKSSSKESTLSSRTNMSKSNNRENSATASGPIPKSLGRSSKDESLRRFFPNLPATPNGILGSVVPANAAKEEGLRPVTQNISNPPPENRHVLSSSPAAVPEPRTTGRAQPSQDTRTTIGLYQHCGSQSSPRLPPNASPSIPIAAVSNPMGIVQHPVGQIPIAMSPPGALPMMLPGMPHPILPAHMQAVHARQAQMAMYAQQQAQQQRHAHHPVPPQHSYPTRYPPDPQFSPRNMTHSFPVQPQQSMNNGIVMSGEKAAIDSKAGNDILSYVLQGSKSRFESGDVRAKLEVKSQCSMVDPVNSVATTMSTLKLHGTDAKRMDKTEFRAVMQRILAEQPLFDQAYNSYSERMKSRAANSKQ